MKQQTDLRRMIRRLSLAFCMLFALFPQLTKNITAYSEGISLKETTLMIYMCGSNLESKNSAASNDITEILHSGLDTDRCNVIIMTGGSTSWTNRDLDTDGIGIFEITKKKNGNALQLSSIPGFSKAKHMNMGESSSLADFLSFCYDNYPARSYALILWDHGGGPMEGVCFDETANMDSLSLSEIQTALSASLPEHSLSWIGIDACLMASLETACICSPFADFLIASQETEPVYGWDYSFLGEIGNKLPIESIPRMIVDDYISQNKSNFMLTLSCIDLTKIDDVKQAVDIMFSALEKQLTIYSFSMLSNERRDSKSFGRATTLSDYDLVDLYHLAQQYESVIPEESIELQAAIEAAVYSDGNQLNANGISIYSPYYNKSSFKSKWHAEYDTLNISSSYSKYMDQYSRIWLGDPLGNWKTIISRAQPKSEETDSQLVELELTEDQLDFFSSAKVVILQSTGEESTYKKVFESENIEPEGNFLRYNYDFLMLYALNRNSQPLTSALAFNTIDDYYILTPILENMPNFGAAGTVLDALQGEDSESIHPQIALSTILRCHRSGEGDTLTVDSYALPETTSITEMSDEALLLAREIENIDVSAFPYLDFEKQNIYRILEEDEDGRPLPYTTWPKTDYSEQIPGYINSEGNAAQYGDTNDLLTMPLDGTVREFGTVDLREPWSLQFVKADESSRTGLYAQFIITDSQGNLIGSELIPLNQSNIESAGKLSEGIYSDPDKGYSFSFTSLEAIKTEDGTELCFSFAGTFPSQSNCILPVISSVEIDGVDIGSLDLASAGAQYDTYDGQNVIRNYRVIVNCLEHSALSDLHLSQIRLIGSIASMVSYEDPNNPFRSRVNMESEIDQTIAVDLDLTSVWNVYGRAEKEGVVYRLKSINCSDNGLLEGTISIVNTSRTHSHNLRWEKDEGSLPGVWLNDYYIGDALEGVDDVELLPNEEETIDFKIRLPQFSADGSEHFILDLWNIKRIESVSFSVIDDSIGYSYFDEEANIYRVFLPGYEKISLSINPVIDISSNKVGLTLDSTVLEDIWQAETEVDGIRYTIFDLNESEEGNLSGLLILTNHSGQQMTCLKKDLFINDFCCSDSFVFPAKQTLYNDETACFPFQISRQSSTQVGKEIEAVDIFDFWNIRTIESLRLHIVYRDSDGNVFFSIVPLQLMNNLLLSQSPSSNQGRLCLLDCEHCEIDFISLRWNDGQFLLEGDIQFQSETEPLWDLYLDLSEIDDIPLKARLLAETVYSTEREYEEFPIRFPSNVHGRFILELSEEGALLPENFETLELQFGFKSSGSDAKQTCTTSKLYPVKPLARSGAPLGTDCFNVKSGEEMNLYVPKVVELPDNPSQYQTTLRVEVDEERIAAAQDTQVLLIAPVEGEPELYSIYLAFDTSPEWIDGWLQLDFCGLVPALSTADSPIPSMHRSENGPGYPCLGQVVIQGINAGGVTQTWWLNDFVFEYDSFAEDAWFSSVSGDIGTTEEYEDPAVLFFSYLIQLREDGSYEMTDAGLSYGPVQVQPYDGAAPEFMLRPAEEFHPFVVFMLEESDTGGHYYMLPYEQAAHR